MIRTDTPPRLEPTGRCARCLEPVHWVTTARNGKNLPLNLDAAVEGRGNFILVDGEAVYIQDRDRSRAASTIYEAHFATCGKRKRAAA